VHADFDIGIVAVFAFDVDVFGGIQNVDNVLLDAGIAIAVQQVDAQGIPEDIFKLVTDAG